MNFNNNNNNQMRKQNSQAPPSCVLLIRSQELFEDNLVNALHSVTTGLGDLPVYSQENKGISFVEFPSLDVATQVMDLINQGGIQVSSGRPMTAEYSTRTEVQQRKRPLDDGSMPEKRPRVQDESPPSRVICVKTDQTEDELSSMLSVTGGNIVNTLLVAGKNMVFIEFSSFEESANALNYVQGTGLQSKSGYNIDAMYSTRQQIVKVSRQTTGAPQMQQNLHHSHSGNQGIQTNHQVNQLTGQINPLLSAPTTQDRKTRDEGPANRVILIGLRAITNAPTPTVENLLPPFSYCGVIEKMIVFSKGAGQCQALVQYTNQEYAALALQKYHNATLGSYNIMVRYSDRPELEVSKNSSMMRDFTNPWLPEFDQTGKR